MNILSLFDGLGGGRIALERTGIKINNYYASEIDKYSIKIAKKNYPDIIELGDINNWREWNLKDIDMIIGGSPCQGFSKAGEGLNFNDPRSKLFFTFVEILNFYKPKYFLLENVKMKKEWRDIISSYLKVEPILINSSLVSAQNRERLYWTNIEVKELPKDKGILLKDIILSGRVERDKSYTIDANYHKGGSTKNHHKKEFQKLRESERRMMVYPIVIHNIYGGFKETEVRVFTEKSPTIRTQAGGGHIPFFVKKDFLLSKEAIEYMDREVKDGRNHWDFNHYSNIDNEKSSAVVANFFKGVPYNVFKDWDCIRKFHPIECERLQTLPDNYTEGVSNTQRYKMIGNGWTIDIISHLFTFLPMEFKNIDN